MAERYHSSAQADVLGTVRYVNPARPGNDSEKQEVNVSLCDAYIYHATSCFTHKQKVKVLRHVLSRTSHCAVDLTTGRTVTGTGPEPWISSAAGRLYMGRVLKPGNKAFWRFDSYLFS